MPRLAASVSYPYEGIAFSTKAGGGAPLLKLPSKLKGPSAFSDQTL